MVSSIAAFMLLEVLPYEMANTIVFVMVCSGSTYLVLGIVSLIVRLFRRRGLNDDDRRRANEVELPITLGNFRTVTFFRGLAFWGVVTYLFDRFVLHLHLSLDGQNAPLATACFGFQLWSILALALMFLISLVYQYSFLPREKYVSPGFTDIVGRMAIADVLAPVRIMKGCFSQEGAILFPIGEGNERQSPRFLCLLCLIVMVLLIVLNAASIIVMR